MVTGFSNVAEACLQMEIIYVPELADSPCGRKEGLRIFPSAMAVKTHFSIRAMYFKEWVAALPKLYFINQNLLNAVVPAAVT